MTDDVYAEFSRTFEEIINKKENKRELIKGYLGFTIGGAYQIRVKDDNTQYYVRIDNKSFVRAFHNGKCAPIPDLPVYIARRPLGTDVYEIVDVDLDLAKQMLPNNVGNLIGAAPHTHDRFSGMAFQIDPRLFTAFQLRVISGLSVYVNAGAYRKEGRWQWFGGDTIDLTSSVPTTAGKQRWALLTLNANDNTITVINGALQSVSSPLTIEQLMSITHTGIPVGAVRLKHGQTNIVETDMEALHVLVDGHPRHNYNGTTDPVATNDETQGYGLGSIWFNQTAQRVFTCFDASAGNAVWVDTTASSGTPITTNKKEINTEILLYTETLTTDGSFDVDISGFEICDALRVEIIARSTANSSLLMVWAVNNDTTNTNYKWQHLQGNNTTAGAGQSQSRMIGILDNINSLSNVWTHIIIDLPNYRSTTQRKIAYSRSAGVVSTSSSFIRFVHSVWLSNSAINRLAFNSQTHDLVAGSTIRIWGIKRIEVVTEVFGTQADLFPIELDYAETIPTNRQIVLNEINIVGSGSLTVNGLVSFIA